MRSAFDGSERGCHISIRATHRQPPPQSADTNACGALEAAMALAHGVAFHRFGCSLYRPTRIGRWDGGATGRPLSTRLLAWCARRCALPLRARPRRGVLSWTTSACDVLRFFVVSDAVCDSGELTASSQDGPCLQTPLPWRASLLAARAYPHVCVCVFQPKTPWPVGCHPAVPIRSGGRGCRPYSPQLRRPTLRSCAELLDSIGMAVFVIRPFASAHKIWARSARVS